ncbi:hypothetical protein BBJ28_00005629 [Nothophytophthora sp. Chile5]|nr:hypothetical protein BBJ28_00005629 [Nothophytophthora sp. Chile5]
MMASLSYAGGGGDDAGAGTTPRWLLFARQQISGGQDASFVFTAVVAMQEKTKDGASTIMEPHCKRHFIAELLVDATAMEEHVRCGLWFLGIEVDTPAFEALLVVRFNLGHQKTLGDRQAVNLLIEDEANAAPVGDSATKPEVTLALTYKFSATISRKGIFQLPLVATDVPQSVVTLLTSIHASPTQPVLSARQKRQRAEKRSLTAVPTDGSVIFADKKQKTTSSQEENGATNASQGEGSGASVPPVNSQVLKRRHVPTGTMYASPSYLRSLFLRTRCGERCVCAKLAKK